MAKDIYSDLIPSTVPPVKESDPYGPTVYDDLLPVADEKTKRLRRSFQVSVQQNPDQFAEAFKLAQKSGVPMEIIDVDKLGWERTVNFNNINFEKLAKQDAFAEWLTDPRNASVATDDLDALEVAVQHISDSKNTKAGWFESVGKSFKSAGVYGVKKNAILAQYGLTMNDPDGVAMEIANINRIQQRIEARKPEYMTEYRKRSSQIYQEAAQGVQEASNVTGHSVFGPLAQVGKGVLKYMWNAITSKGSIPSETETIAGSLPVIGAGVGAGVAGSATGPAAPFVVPAAIAGATMATEVPLEYGSWVEQRIAATGIDMTDPAAIADKLRDMTFFKEVSGEALRKGVGTAAVDSLMAAFGGKLVAGSIRKGVEEVGKSAVKQTFLQGAKTVAMRTAPALALEQGAQVAGGAMSEIVGQGMAVGSEKINWNDVWDEAMGEVFFGGGEVLSGAAVHSLAMPRQKAVGLVKNTIAAYQGWNAYESLKAGVNAYSQSKLAARSPEHLASLQEAVGGDKPVTFEVADIEAFATSNNTTAAQIVSDITGNIDAFADAKTLGTEITLPMGKLTQALYNAPDKASADKLMKSANIVGMSALKAKEFAQNAEKYANEIVEEQTKIDDLVNSLLAESSQTEDVAVDPNAPAKTTTQQVASAAKKQIELQLLKVGYGKQEASTNAAIMAAIAATRAERSGLNFDEVMASLPSIIGEKRSDRLDIDLDKVRYGAIPTEKDIGGESLVEFLRRNGGIQDQGGELSALDAARARPGLVSGKGMTLDRAAMFAAENGYNVNEVMDRGSEPTINGLLAALRDDLSGKGVYSESQRDVGLAEYRDGLIALEAEVQRLGLDLKTASNAEIRAKMDQQYAEGYNQKTLPETIEIDGIQRSTVNSEGKPIAATEEGVRNFWKWFGNSQVIDKDGNPLVVYHGTGKQFDVFDLGMAGSATDSGFLGVGGYFTDNKKVADIYAKRNGDKGLIVATYLKIENMYNWGVKTAGAADESTIPIDIQKDVLHKADKVVAKNSPAQEEPGVPKGWGSISPHSPEQERMGIVSGAITQVLKERGYQGVFASMYANGREFVVFDPSQIKSAEANSGAFDPSNPSILMQKSKDKSAGQYNQITNVLTLFSGRDKSTFIHETGHWYLATQQQLIDTIRALPEPNDAQKQLLSDWDGVMKFLGVSESDWRKMSIDEKRPYHEKMAVSFEAYLMRGVAPSKAMRSVFARMADWIKSIYRAASAILGKKETINDLIAKAAERNNIPAFDVSPEVLEIMDRIMASDKEIAEAHQIVDRALPGDTPEMALMRNEARQEAESELRTKLMDDLSKENRKARHEARKRIEPVVRDEVNQRPIYVAIDTMRGKTEGVEGFKINLEEVREKFGDKTPMFESIKKHLVTTTTEGISANDAAMVLGFESGDALLLELANTPDRREVVKTETDARIEAEFPSLIRDPAAMSDEAMRAIHSEKRDALLEREMAILGAKVQDATREANAGRKDAALRAAQVSLQKIKETAREAIRKRTHRNLNPNTYLRAERKAAQEAFDFAVADKFEQALEAKRRQAANAALYRESVIALELAEKAKKSLVASMSKTAEGHLGRAGQIYLDRRDEILEGIELKNVSGTKVERRERLAEWLAKVDARMKEAALNGEMYEPPYDAVVLAGLSKEANTKNWRDIPLGVMFEISDAVQSILHQAKRKDKLTGLHKDRLIGEAKDAMIGNMEENLKALPVADIAEERSSLTKVANGLRTYSSLHRSLQSWARQVDGGKSGGSFWEYMVRPFNEAADRELEMTIKVRDKIKALAKKFDDARKGKPESVMIKEIGRSLKIGSRIMVAMNWGNQGNRERMMAGHNWQMLHVDQGGPAFNESHAQAIINTLSKEEMDYVQGMLDLINEFWPEIAEKERRVSGVIPDKVEATPIVTDKGIWKGGYFPIVYDTVMSSMASKTDEVDQVKRLFMGTMYHPQTKRNHVLARGAGMGVPLKLSTDVISSHLSQIIHDLAFHETLLDFTKIINDKSFADSMRSYLGPNVIREMRQMAVEVASGGAAKGFLEHAANFVRRGGSIAVMGYSLSTVLAQIPQITNTMHRVGWKNGIMGLINMYGNPLKIKAKMDAVFELSSMMRGRSETWILDAKRSDKAIRESMAEGGVVKSTLKVHSIIADNALLAVQKMQMMIDLPTWQAEFDRAKGENASDKDAAAMADQAVIDAQGSGRAHELSHIQRNKLAQLFTQFISWKFVLYNRHAEGYALANKAWREGKHFKAAGMLGSDILTLELIPLAMISALAVMMGKGPKDGEDEGEWFAKKMGKEGVSMIPLFGVGEITGPIANGQSYHGPAGTRVLSTLTDMATQTKQGEVDHALVRAYMDFIGTMLHLPTNQIMKTVDGINYLEENPSEGSPANALFGPPPKK